MFDRPDAGERALLIQLALDSHTSQTFSEFKELALSAGADIVGEMLSQRKFPEPKYFLGEGKALEIKAYVKAQHIELVLINHELSPSQERNLEALIECRVVSRSGLILDIFAKRARTFEGKLQVELAQLEHLSTRLIRGWTHLERQKGGIGLRGPGETQLETDRRLLREKIKTIKKRLAKVKSNRAVSRKARSKAQVPTLSLVGYTNAGKSTLFNALTHDKVFAKDQLFATLDPTMRQLKIPGFGPVILVDTVGFIQDLPHALVQAFRATLEETCLADAILHVVDISDDAWRAQVDAVEKVLQEIEAADIPCLTVYNKIDKKAGFTPTLKVTEQSFNVWVSALEKQGFDALFQGILHTLGEKLITCELTLSSKDAKLRAHLYELDAVIDERTSNDGTILLTVRVAQKVLAQV